MEMPEKVKKLLPGEEYIFYILDENGFEKITTWGLTIPPLRIHCLKSQKGVGKILCWDYDFFGDFIYESCARGVSTERFDNFLYEETGIRGYCLKYLMTDKEKYAELNNRRLEYNRNAVKMIQDLDAAPLRYDPLQLKMMELKNKSRLGVLARLDPEFREKIEQKIDGNIAQIVLPQKECDESDETSES